MENRFEKHKTKIYAAMALFFLLLIGAGVYIGYASLMKDIRKGYTRHILLRECSPLSTTWHTSSETGEKVVRRGDENGFIMPSRVHDTPDFSIVFLGGSTTECLSNKETERFPYLAGRLLEQKTGKKINSYNGGKSGSSSSHSVLALFGKVVPMHPDAVVLMHAVNDLMLLMTAKTYWAHHYRHGIIQDKQYDPIKTWLIEKELGHTFLKSPINDHDQYRGKPGDLDTQRISTAFRKMLELFIFICRQHEITPVLMTQASRITETPDTMMRGQAVKFKKDFFIEYDDFYNAYTMLNETTRNVAQKNNVLLIDLAREVPSDDEYIYDSVHLTSKGSKLVAELISKKMAKLVAKDSARQ